MSLCPNFLGESHPAATTMIMLLFWICWLVDFVAAVVRWNVSCEVLRWRQKSIEYLDRLKDEILKGIYMAKAMDGVLLKVFPTGEE
jgi:hypothetical protein